MGFPGGLDGKEFSCNAGNLDLIPGLRRFLGEGNGNPLQYSSVEKDVILQYRITVYFKHSVPLT